MVAFKSNLSCNVILTAAMGGIGYVFGHYCTIDPKLTALIWLVSTAARQIFSHFALPKEKSTIKLALNMGTGAVGSLFMYNKGLIHGLSQGVLTSLAIALSLTVSQTLISKFIHPFEKSKHRGPAPT